MKRSHIAEEKTNLLPYQPKLELAEISEHTVNSYSFVCVDNNFYSVPEYLVRKPVTVKKYYDEIIVYANNIKVCTHQSSEGFKQMKVDIYHYLDALRKKPGALRNSLALKSIPALKGIFDRHYVHRPKKFITLFMENKELPIHEIIRIFEVKSGVEAIDEIKSEIPLCETARAQLIQYNSLRIGGSIR